MPRLIFISPHFKSGAGNAAHLSYLVRYIATREERLPLPLRISINQPRKSKSGSSVKSSEIFL